MKGAPAITRRPVIAIITDESEAIIVAHYAVWAASEQKRPVLLLVPLPRPAFTTDPTIAARMYRRGLHEAQILTTRARAVLDAAGFAVPTRVAWHGAWSLKRSRPAQATALAREVKRAGAAVVVTPVEMPAALMRDVTILSIRGVTWHAHPAPGWEKSS